MKISNFGKNEKVLSWCDDLKKTRKIQKEPLFFGLEKIISRKTRFFLKSKPLKIWNFVKNEKFRLDVTISKKQEKSKKSHFFGLGEILAVKHVFFKSKPLKIWNFGKNEKFFLDVTISKNKKWQKKSFSAYGKLLAEKHVFF